MLTRWNEFDQTFSMLEDLQRRMNRVFYDYDSPSALRLADDVYSRGLPRMNVYDTGSTLLVRVEVPGMSDKDVKLTLNQDVLTLGGERASDVPKGYSVHRQERAAIQFSRSVSLPCSVDPEKTMAVVKDGVLTVTLGKSPEAQPRQITVRAQ